MQGSGSGPSRPSRLWYLLLLPPYLAMIWVSSYNTVEPSWAGIPFAQAWLAAIERVPQAL